MIRTVWHRNNILKGTLSTVFVSACWGLLCGIFAPGVLIAALGGMIIGIVNGVITYRRWPLWHFEY